MRTAKGMWVLILGVSGCLGAPENKGSVEVDYLGHASFLMTFPNGTTVLTDYGASRAWGLDSPVYPLGGVVPDYATLSHDHLDHGGGVFPEGVEVLRLGEPPPDLDGLSITFIPTFERQLSEADNASVLFKSAGMTILHLGDCQALMVALGQGPTRASATDRIRQLYPDRYDLVFLPIGFTRDILTEAQLFLSLLDARQVIPMHFWTPTDLDRFLDLFGAGTGTLGREVNVLRVPGSRWTLEKGGEGRGGQLILGLSPGPPGTRVPRPDP